MSIAFIFPGQGSQSVGMLSSILEQNPKYGEIVITTFKQASDVLGFDLWALTQNGPEEELNKTRNTQPAILTASYALWQIWNEKEGKVPAIMAGHSLGEYTALVCAEAIDFADAVDLVNHRGRYMQDAVQPGEGAMAAILGLDDDAVIKVCEATASQLAAAGQERVVSAVNFNAPGQVVIAGHSDAVDKAIEAANESGAKKSVKLAVSVPSHCALMEEAAEKLSAKLRLINIQRPVIPVINNVHVTIENDGDLIRDALVKQLSRPVRWVETINKMISEGSNRIVECGPGKVLTGLNRRINRRMPADAVYDAATIDKLFEELS
jgi:[acyl-carrier-protein] S-malonyltransferase